MKVVILGKGEMLANLIEGTLDANCEIAGIFRYERTVMPEILLAIKERNFVPIWKPVWEWQKRLPWLRNILNKWFKNIVLM